MSAARAHPGATPGELKTGIRREAKPQMRDRLSQVQCKRMGERYDIAIAGGGIVGCSILCALAKLAANRGAPIKRNCPVSDFRETSGGWELGTPNGGIEASQLVLAASFWTRELALKIGMDLPLFAVEHQALITNAIPELISREGEVPTIRDSSAPCNFRQDGKSPLIGIYEREPKIWGADGIPPDFVQELLPPDLDRLEEHLE